MRIAKLLVLIGFCSLCGCAVYEYAKPEGPPSNSELFENFYRQVELRKSSSADVLTAGGYWDNELLSQSKRVVAWSGQKKKGYKSWLKMVAFDENDSRANRKYLFIEDEKPKVLFSEPRANVSFDCKMILAKDVLDEPYADENSRRIAILRRVMENVGSDVSEVSEDNRMIVVAGMMISQALQAVLVKLDSSPGQAKRLSELRGVDFSHMSFGRGKIQMAINDEIVSVKMKLGSNVKKVMGNEKCRCLRCEYIYNPVIGDPNGAIKAGTSFENLPEDWVCPNCGAGKNEKF